MPRPRHAHSRDDEQRRHLPPALADDPDAPEDDEIVPGKGDVDEAMRLLEWSRKRGFSIGSFSIGRVVVNGIRDLRPIHGAATKAEPKDIFVEYGMKDEG